MMLLRPVLSLAAVVSASVIDTQIRLGSQNTPKVDVNNATAWSIIYGYPLVPFIRYADAIISKVGVNSLHVEAGLANSSDKAVVRPNVDTLYSQIAIDLSSGNVELEIPEVEADRWYAFSFYDVYGNNFVNIGSGFDTAPGKYLVRLVNGSEQAGFDAVGDSASSDYLGYINYHTAYGTMLSRFLLLNTSSDVSIVDALMEATNVTTVSRHDEFVLTDIPELEDFITEFKEFTGPIVYPGDMPEATIEKLLAATAYVHSYSPTESADYVEDVDSFLITAGVSQRKYTRPENVDFAEAAGLVDRYIRLAVADEDSYVYLSDSWQSKAQEVSGNFENHWAMRTWISYEGYLMLTSDIAIYPIYLGKGELKPYIEKETSLIFTFSQKPPVTGFWSLTAYGMDSYLIPNPINVYSLGDRSNLTYPDGASIYHDEESLGRDETFEILIQAADIPPPANWTSNWLPGPAGGGDFLINLRYYEPTESILNLSYVQPVVTRIPTLVA